MNLDQRTSFPRRPFAVLALAIGAVVLGGMFVATGSSHAAGEGAPTDPQGFINLMHDYLDLGQQWVSMAETPSASAYLAIEGIVEIYEQRGAKPQAIGHLNRLLTGGRTTPVVETLIRFKLRDLYNETRQGDKALAELDRILESTR